MDNVEFATQGHHIMERIAYVILDISETEIYVLLVMQVVVNAQVLMQANAHHALMLHLFYKKVSVQSLHLALLATSLIILNV